MTSVTAYPSAAGEIGKQRLAQRGATLAAVLGEIGHQRSQGIYIGALDLLTTALLGRDQTGLCENGQVSGERALGQAARLNQTTGRKTFWFVSNKQPKSIQPGRVGKRRKR